MKNYWMEIAGVCFDAGGDNPEALLPADPFYKPFLFRGQIPDSHVKIQIHTLYNDLPDISEMDILFDSHQAWVLYRKGSDYCLVFYSGNRNHRLWTAVFEQSCSSVTLYLSDEWIKNPIPVLTYPLDQIVLMVSLAQRKGVLIHGAGVVIGETGFILTGAAGSGKSTVARLFTESDTFSVLSDERIVIRNEAENFKMFGTPWYSDAQQVRNDNAVLKAVFCLNHGSENDIRPIDRRNVAERLLPVLSVPWYDSSLIKPLLDLCDIIVDQVPVYDLYFRPDETAIHVISDFFNRKV